MGRRYESSYYYYLEDTLNKIKEAAEPYIDRTSDPIWIGCENKGYQALVEGDQSFRYKVDGISEKYNLLCQIHEEAKKLVDMGAGGVVFLPFEKENIKLCRIKEV